MVFPGSRWPLPPAQRARSGCGPRTVEAGPDPPSKAQKARRPPVRDRRSFLPGKTLGKLLLALEGPRENAAATVPADRVRRRRRAVRASVKADGPAPSTKRKVRILNACTAGRTRTSRTQCPLNLVRSTARLRRARPRGTSAHGAAPRLSPTRSPELDHPSGVVVSRGPGAGGSSAWSHARHVSLSRLP